jgi:antitoxin Phd
MIQIWPLQEARDKLSQVIDSAISGGPQVITRRGVEVAVVLSYEEYKRMTATQHSLSEFFRQSPLAQVDLDLTRDESAAWDDIQL